ncbi:MAG: hypothetical protein ABSC06_27345 [Rhodopila sp.]|jgi:hypothetical protein
MPAANGSVRTASAWIERAITASMMATRMKAGPAPEATAAAQDITSEVSADVVLTRRAENE